MDPMNDAGRACGVGGIVTAPPGNLPGGWWTLRGYPPAVDAHASVRSLAGQVVAGRPAHTVVWTVHAEDLDGRQLAAVRAGPDGRFRIALPAARAALVVLRAVEVVQDDAGAHRRHAQVAPSESLRAVLPWCEGGDVRVCISPLSDVVARMLDAVWPTEAAGTSDDGPALLAWRRCEAAAGRAFAWPGGASAADAGARWPVDERGRVDARAGLRGHWFAALAGLAEVRGLSAESLRAELARRLLAGPLDRTFKVDMVGAAVLACADAAAVGRSMGLGREDAVRVAEAWGRVIAAASCEEAPVPPAQTWSVLDIGLADTPTARSLMGAGLRGMRPERVAGTQALRALALAVSTIAADAADAAGASGDDMLVGVETIVVDDALRELRARPDPVAA